MRRSLWCLLLLMCLVVAPTSGLSSVPAAAAARAEGTPHLGYGMMLAHTAHLGYIRDAGFDWYKYFVRWDVVDPDRDRSYNWDSVDWLLDDACTYGLHVLMRIERDSNNWTPIQDAEMQGWEAFFTDLAAHIAVRRAECAAPPKVALEVWNEPNLGFQWVGQPLDPARYTEMVRRAYRGAKAGDPHSLIVAGGLAPTGGTADGYAMDDVVFLRAMYAAGLKGHFDAISIHNYGYGSPPEDKDAGSGILNFRRAEDIYAVMVAHGDSDKPVWGTEFGWLLASSGCSAYWDSICFGWQQVTASEQADYLTRAFVYADANWPWMQVMIVSNLDFAVMPWYAPCDPLRYFSIRDANNAPRPAYMALTQMPKHPRSWAALGMALDPPVLAWMMPVMQTQTVTQTVVVRNIGELPFHWSVAVDDPGVLERDSSASLPVSTDPVEGECGQAFTVAVAAAGLLTGTYTATLTVTVDQAEMPDNPRALPIVLHVVNRIERVYVPLVARGP